MQSASRSLSMGQRLPRCGELLRPKTTMRAAIIVQESLQCQAGSAHKTSLEDHSKNAELSQVVYESSAPSELSRNKPVARSRRITPDSAECVADDHRWFRSHWAWPVSLASSVWSPA